MKLELSTSSSRVPYRDGSIKVKVKVKAVAKSAIIGTSGFKGTLNVACNEHGATIFQKTMRIEDETVLDIDFKNDLKKLEVQGSSSFKLFADFIHDATNKTFKASTSFSVEISDYIISVVHSPQFFKPGIPYSFTLLATKADGYPVINSEVPVEVTVHDESKALLLEKSYTLDPATGSVEVEVKGISINASRLDIKIMYESLEYVEKVFKDRSKQKDFLSINVLTAR